MQIARHYLDLSEETGHEADAALKAAYERELLIEQAEARAVPQRKGPARHFRNVHPAMLAQMAAQENAPRLVEPDYQLATPAADPVSNRVKPQAPTTATRRGRKRLAQGIAQILLDLMVLQGRSFDNLQKLRYELQRDLEMGNQLEAIHRGLAPVITAAISGQAWEPIFRQLVVTYPALQMALEEQGVECLLSV